MTDNEILGGVLRRFLQGASGESFGNRPPWFYINPEQLSLDGQIEITEDEARVMYGITDRWNDSLKIHRMDEDWINA